MMESFIEAQKRLLTIERDEEVTTLGEQLKTLSGPQAEAAGISLTNLYICNMTTSLFGRFSVVLKKSEKVKLPHVYKVGDEVTLTTRKGTVAISIDATVSVITTSEITVVIESGEDELNDDFDVPIRLNRRVSDATFKKMMKCLATMQGEHCPLSRMLYGHSSHLELPAMAANDKIAKFYNDNLNDSQRLAVENALTEGSHGLSLFSIVHGPPGTGKTSTVAEIVLQAAVRKGLRVLVAAPSNVAVDNVLERVASSGLKNLQCIRLGHPSRINKGVLDYCLESLISRDDASEIVLDVKKDIENVHKDIASKRRQVSMKDAYRELKELRTELRQREKKIVKDIIAKSNVVFATCIGADSSLLRDQIFDVVVIDEAAQSLEAASWIPACKGRSVVFAGDHCQLPPTIKSKEAERQGLSLSLFEKLIREEKYASRISLLNVQYRMHHTICSWASAASYHGLLLSDKSVANRSLNGFIKTLPSASTASGALCAQANLVSTTISFMANTSSSSSSSSDSVGFEGEVYPVMTLVDTSGCDLDEAATIDGSHSNIHEALIVKKYVSLLILDGLRPQDIGVITPYNGQVDTIRELFQTEDDINRIRPSSSSSSSSLSPVTVSTELLSSVEIRTVDGFQGGEKEVIILSLVRSNSGHEIGFLGDRRRINVAVTRAKRHVAIICDTDTCNSDEFIRNLIAHASSLGDHRSALEFTEDGWEEASLLYDPKGATNIDSEKSGGSSSSGAKVKAKLQSSKIGGGQGNVPGKVPGKIFPKTTSKSSTGLNDPRAIAEDLEKGDFEQSARQLIQTFNNHMKKVNGTSVNGSSSNSSSIIDAIYDKKCRAWCSEKGVIIKEGSIVFPSSFSPFFRRLVHQICDEFGSDLLHESKGDDADRYIELTSKLPSVQLIMGNETAKAKVTASADSIKKSSNFDVLVDSDDKESQVTKSDAAKEDDVDGEDEGEEEEDAALGGGIDKKKKKKKKKKKAGGSALDAGDRSVSTPDAPPPSFIFNKGSNVYYQKDKSLVPFIATVLDVYKDDFPNVYFLIRLQDGTEKQTEGKYLTPIGIPPSFPTSASLSASKAHPAPNSAPLLGTRLKECREQLGLSVDECAMKTKIRAHYISSIENNAFKTLPLAEHHIKTIVIDYAKFLNLEPNLDNVKNMKQLEATFAEQYAAASSSEAPSVASSSKKSEPAPVKYVIPPNPVKANKKGVNIHHAAPSSNNKKDLSIDELLEESIRENEAARAKEAEDNKYRIYSAPLPNPELSKKQADLKNSLKEMQKSRAPQSKEKSKNGDSKKK